MAETSVAVDSMIKEYLVFRGFSLTLKSFEAELKGDKNKQFKVSFFCLKRSRYPIFELKALNTVHALERPSFALKLYLSQSFSGRPATC